jgi:hypothetical protein
MEAEHQQIGITPSPMPFKSVTIVREAFADGVRVTTSVGRADGSQINFTYNEIRDGTEHPVPGTGAPFGTVSTKQIDANTLTDKRRKTGASFESMVRTLISTDGKTMTTTAVGVNTEGKPSKGMLVSTDNSSWSENSNRFVGRVAVKTGPAVEEDRTCMRSPFRYAKLPALTRSTTSVREG